MFLTTQRYFLEEMQSLGIEVVLPGTGQQCMALQIRLALVEQVKAAQSGDEELRQIKEQVEAGLRSDLVIHSDGSLRFGSRLCVPRGSVRQELLAEAQSSSYSIHPGGTKMYRDLRQHYW